MLGNSRFLIVIISVLMAVALICLGASAVERVSPDDVSRDGGFRISPTDLQYPPRELFSSFSVLETVSGDNSTRGGTLVNAFPLSNPLSVTYYSVQMQDLTDHWQTAYTGSFDEPVEISFKDDSGWFRIYIDGVRLDTVNMYTQGRCRAVFYNDVSAIEGEYSGFTYRTIYGLLDPSSLFGVILSVGSSLVSFVISSWVVLVPVVAFVCILGFGVIRRLVKGV